MSFFVDYYQLINIDEAKNKSFLGRNKITLEIFNMVLLPSWHVIVTAVIWGKVRKKKRFRIIEK